MISKYLIKRIINNIFSNLLKYAENNETVHISMISDENNLKLVFKNKKIFYKLLF